MLTRNQIATFLALSVAFWVVLLVIKGIAVSAGMLIPFSGVVGAVSLTLAIFNRWMWHWPVFNGWLVNRPFIRGTWRVQLKSDWVDTASGKQLDAISGYMVVRQTGSELSLRLLTAESRSETVSSGIEICSDGTFEITCTYRNKPKPEYRHRSEVHYGAMLLVADTRRPGRLEGDYWTDRKTTGSISLFDRENKIVASFFEADRLFLPGTTEPAVAQVSDGQAK